MTAQDIKAVLQEAIGREEDSFRFYSEAAHRVADETVRETFEELAQEELGHKAFLQSCVRDPDLTRRIRVPADYRVAEATEGVELSVDMKPADAIALAMKREQHAAELYRDLAEHASDPELRRTLEDIAQMEIGHKTRLEAMYMDVGYPEAF